MLGMNLFQISKVSSILLKIMVYPQYLDFLACKVSFKYCLNPNDGVYLLSCKKTELLVGLLEF